MSTSNADAFRLKVQKFMKRWGYTPSSFGRKAAGYPNFVQRLKAGANITIETVDRIEAWMKQQEAVHKKGIDLRWQPSAPQNPRGRPPLPPIVWTRQMDTKLRRLRLQKQPWTQIAKTLGVSENTARRRHEIITGIALPKRGPRHKPPESGGDALVPHKDANE